MNEQADPQQNQNEGWAAVQAEVETPEALSPKRSFTTPVAIGVVILAVIAGGIFYFFAINERVVDDGVDVVEEVATDISDWKTYSNEEFGFEFQYPQKWSLEIESPESFQLTEPGEFYDQPYDFQVLGVPSGGLMVAGWQSGVMLMTYNQENNSFDFVSKTFDQEGVLQGEKQTEHHFYIDSSIDSTSSGISVYRTYTGDGPTPPRYIVPLSNILILDIVPRGDFNHINLLDVIRSVKLIETIDISDWKTYRNEEFGFEFRYPSDWVVSDKLMDIFVSTYSSASRTEIIKGIQVALVKEDKENYYIDLLTDPNNEYLNIDGIGLDGDYIDIRTLLHFRWDEFFNKIPENEHHTIVENVVEFEVSGSPARQGRTIRGSDSRDKIVTLVKYPEKRLSENNDTGFVSVQLSMSYNNGNYEKEVLDGVISTFKFID